MKTYEEMAQSVLLRAKSHRTIRRRRIIGAAATTCVLVICMGIILIKTPVGSEAPTLQTLTVTEPSSAPAQAHITFLYNDGKDATCMDKDILIPCRNQLRVQDISGLSATEADAVAETEKKYANELITSYSEEVHGGWCQYYGENVVMTSIHVGYFVLRIEDPKQVERIHASTKGAVGLTNLPGFGEWEYDANANYPTPREYGLTHKEVQQYYGSACGGLGIGWIFGGELMKLFEKELIPLSTLRDTITITVTYLDGTVETHAIDMIFDDNGEVYAIYQGATALT